MAIIGTDPRRAWSGKELAEQLQVKPRNLLTQLGGLCLTFGGDGVWCYPSRMRWRSRVNPARPYICRLIIFVLVFTPSVRPL